jgi:predicted nucleotidyltransferase
LAHPVIIDPPAKLRHRDVFQDVYNNVFVTLGHIQPEGRVLSIFKYIPDPEGIWLANGINFRRVFSSGTASAASGIAIAPDDYVVHDNHFGTDLLEPPRNAIVRYYSPEHRLKEILTEGPMDLLESSVQIMAETIHDVLGSPFERIGVTGSIVWKAHDLTRSDINLNVYGLEESIRLHEGFEQLAEQHDDIRLLETQDWSQWMIRLRERITEYPQNALTTLFSRRRGFFCQDHFVSVIPVLLSHETPIPHGSESYETITQHPVCIESTLHTSSYSMFTPAIYDCKSDLVETVEARVTRVLVYDGAFVDVFHNGDKVEMKGTLQRVTPRNGDVFYQLMVGTKKGAGREYIRIVE